MSCSSLCFPFRVSCFPFSPSCLLDQLVCVYIKTKNATMGPLVNLLVNICQLYIRELGDMMQIPNYKCFLTLQIHSCHPPTNLRIIHNPPLSPIQDVLQMSIYMHFKIYYSHRNQDIEISTSFNMALVIARVSRHIYQSLN